MKGLFVFALALSAMGSSLSASPVKRHYPPTRTDPERTLLPPARIISFQGFVLGSSQKDLQAVILPASKYGPRTVECADRNVKGAGEGANLLPAEISAGVTRCWVASPINGVKYSSDLQIGMDISAMVEMYIFHDKLVRIVVNSEDYNSTKLLDAIKIKYGDASDVKNDSVQTKGGLTVPRISANWKFSNGSIDLISPFGSMNKMIIIYDGDGAAEMDEAVRLAGASGVHL